MTNRIMRSLTITAGVVGLLTLGACADNVVQPVFGNGCRTAALRAGETLEGRFTDESCALPYHFYTGNAAHYASYTVTLEKGKGYMFTMQQAPDEDGENDVDALLALFGRDENGASVPLAVSDDDGEGFDGHDSEFYFIAPRSGTFNLVAGTYSWDDFGGYRVSMRECPVVAVADSAGAYTDLPFAQSDCVRHALVGATLSRIVLVGVKADPFERIEVAVSSDDFASRVEFGGPGTDVFDNIYEEVNFVQSATNPANLLLYTDAVGGTLTLAVGSSSFDPTGRFSVEVDRQEATLVAQARAASTGFTLRQPRQRPVKR